MRIPIEESWERPGSRGGPAGFGSRGTAVNVLVAWVYAHRIQPIRVTARYASTASAIRAGASNRRPTVQTSGVWRGRYG